MRPLGLYVFIFIFILYGVPYVIRSCLHACCHGAQQEGKCCNISLVLLLSRCFVMCRITSYTCIQTFHFFSLSLQDKTIHTRLHRSIKPPS